MRASCHPVGIEYNDAEKQLEQDQDFIDCPIKQNGMSPVVQFVTIHINHVMHVLIPRALMKNTTKMQMIMVMIRR